MIFSKISRLVLSNQFQSKEFLIKNIPTKRIFGIYLSNKSHLNDISSYKHFSSSNYLFQNKKQQPSQKLTPVAKNYDSKSNKNAFWYILSGFVIMIGASYAAVPLFKLFCESQGIDINTEFRDMNVETLTNKLSSMKKVESRNIEVKFVATTNSDLLWKFEPCQETIVVAPGETALAFFKAKNLTDRSIIGIATYTILPYDAGLYFNKIQCFCFEEQRLDPNEEVDMPVFFYIDEEYARDPKLKDVDQICLSYCFFESKGSEDLERIQKLRPN